MIDISPELQNAFNARQREVFAEVVVNFSDITLNPSAEVTSAENNEPNTNQQIINGNTVTDCKWLCLDGIGDLSGDWCLMPEDPNQNVHQVGFWSSDITGVDGSCNVTFNILQNPKDLTGIRITGDNFRSEFPVDFTIEFYSLAGLQYSDVVTNHNSILYLSESPTVLTDINRITMTITKWSTPLTPVKILSALTSLERTFSGSDILGFNIQEESEITGTSSIPTGNISYSQASFSLINRNRIFDINNTQSPLYQQVKPNSKVDVYFGARTVNGLEKFKAFSGWTEGFDAPENNLKVSTRAYDRLKRLSLTFMSPTPVVLNNTVGQLFNLVLTDADISSEFINIDPRLFENEYTVPVFFIQGEDHLTELRRISEAYSCSVYVHNDVINVDSIEAISFKYETQETYGLSDYSAKTNKPLYEGIYNTVNVPYSILSLSAVEELYTTPTEELELIEVGLTEKTFVLSENKCVDQTVDYIPVTGVNIIRTNLFSDRIIIEFENTNTTPTEISLAINGKYYRPIINKVISKTDTESRQEYGANDFTYDKNELLQTSGLASIISTNVLNTYKDPYRDVTIDLKYAGNPALELTDKIGVVDRYLEQSYNIVSKKTTFDGGLSMTLKARKAALKDLFLVNHNGDYFVNHDGAQFVLLASDIVETSLLVNHENKEYVNHQGLQYIMGA